MRLPSVSYWPPWHGQPKPAGVDSCSVTLPFSVFPVVVLPIGPFACTGQPRWAHRLEMIVKLGTFVEPDVTLPLFRMNAVRLDVDALRRIEHERRDVPLALGEVVDGPEVDRVVLLPEKARQDGEAGDRDGDDGADHGAEAERRRLEELAARVALRGVGGRRRDDAGSRELTVRGLAHLRLDRDMTAAQLPRRLARPDEAEDDRDHQADRRDPQRVDDQPDEDHDDAEGEAHGADRRGRQVLLVVLCRVH